MDQTIRPARMIWDSMRPGQVLIGFLRPMGLIETIRDIANKGVTSFSVELMPRTTRAQSMDALSSMATVCGYKAVILAADTLPRLFPMLTTAAGTITPARVLVIGAGVAGLQAIATARRLGALPRRTTSGRPPRNRSKASAGDLWSCPSKPRTRRTREAMHAHRMKRSINASENSLDGSWRRPTS